MSKKNNKDRDEGELDLGGDGQPVVIRTVGDARRVINNIKKYIPEKEPSHTK